MKHDRGLLIVVKISAKMITELKIPKEFVL